MKILRKAKEVKVEVEPQKIIAEEVIQVPCEQAPEVVKEKKTRKKRTKKEEIPVTESVPSESPIKGVQDIITVITPTHKADMETKMATVGTRRVGISKGLTVSTGEPYEFLRIDYWMERVVEDDDTVAEKAVNEMSEIVDNYLVSEVEKIR